MAARLGGEEVRPSTLGYQVHISLLVSTVSRVTMSGRFPTSAFFLGIQRTKQEAKLLNCHCCRDGHYVQLLPTHL
jgi:hypothetical protein